MATPEQIEELKEQLTEQLKAQLTPELKKQLEEEMKVAGRKEFEIYEKKISGMQAELQAAKVAASSAGLPVGMLALPPKPFKIGLGDIEEYDGTTDPEEWTASTHMRLIAGGVTNEETQVSLASMKFPLGSRSFQWLQLREEAGEKLPTTWAEWVALVKERFRSQNRRLQSWQEFNSLQCGMRKGELPYLEYRQAFDNILLKLGPKEMARDAPAAAQRFMEGLRTSGALFSKVLEEDEEHFQDTESHLTLDELQKAADRAYYVMSSVRLARQGRFPVRYGGNGGAARNTAYNGPEIPPSLRIRQK